MQKNILGKEIRSVVKNPKLIQQRRNQIFEAAAELYKKKGYHVTGLRELSSKAGISLGNLYNYITTKEDVLSIVHQKAAEKISKSIDEKTSNVSDPVEKLCEMIDIELHTMNKYQDLIMLIYQEGHALSKQSAHSLLAEEERHLQKFQVVLENGIKKGVFRQCNTLAVAHVIKMMIDSWVLKRWSLRGRVSLKEMKKSILDLVQYGIMKEGIQGKGKKK